MAVEITPLGFRAPDGNEKLRNGDNDIAANAYKAQELHTDARARLANLEVAATADAPLDGGTASTAYTGEEVIDGGTATTTYPDPPAALDMLDLNDSAVVQAVSAGPESKAYLDGRYAPLVGSMEYATPEEVDSVIAATRAEMERAYPAGRGKGRVTVGETRVALGVDTRYAAFPIQCKLNDGRLLMVWYEATDHITTRDGIVVGSYSADNGQTWGPKITLQSQAGIDLRDPTVSTSSDGSILYLTYIKCTAAKPRDGFFLRRSTDNGATFGPEVRIDPVGSNGAGTGPVVEMADGRLIAVWFGALDGETWDSCWRAYSSDDGFTWSAAERFRNGTTDGRHYNEPYASVWGNNVVVMYRHGNDDSLGVTRSSNSAGAWSVPAVAFVGTGRPSNVLTTNGTLIVVYRDNPGAANDTQHAVMRYSHDLGVNWTQARMVERADPRWMLYSCPTEIAPGVVICSNAIEVSTTSARISVRYLLEGGAVSPYGDVAPSPERLAAARLNTIAIADSFDRPNSTSIGRSDDGQFWSAAAGPQIKDSSLEYTGSGGPFLVMAKALSAHVTVEADLYWATSSGVALVFRYADASNYWMVALEDSGAAIRLYKVQGGTPTQVATAAVSAPAGFFQRVKVSAIGDNIRVFFEDVAVFAATDAALNTAEWVGVRLGVAATNSTHRVRNFVTHRRSGRLS